MNREASPRGIRLSTFTEYTRESDDEPPPPSYDEAAMTVDEAVAKAVSNADNKQASDEEPSKSNGETLVHIL